MAPLRWAQKPPAPLEQSDIDLPVLRPHDQGVTDHKLGGNL